MLVWNVLLVFTTQHLLQSVICQPAGKSYHSETPTQGVCSGQNYEVGCGYADGSRVMKVVQVDMEMEQEITAFSCQSGGLCFLQIEDESMVSSYPTLLNVYKSIVHNCQGRPMCTGTLPHYSEVAYSFPEGAHDGLCGIEPTEYLSKLHIRTRCVDASTVPTLEPYVLTVEPATVKPTAPPTQPTTPVPTTKMSEEKTTTVANGGKKGKHSSESEGLAKKETWILFAALGSVAVAATIIGVGVTVYILTRRSRSRQLTVQINSTEHPLQDKEKGDISLDDKQPMNT